MNKEADKSNPDPHSGDNQLAAHLISLELALLDPAVRHDRARVESLLADDFQEFGASGKVWSRTQILDLLESESSRPITAHDLACYFIADRVALVTYRTASNHLETGHPLTALRSSLWVFVDGHWKIRFHQGTREHQP